MPLLLHKADSTVTSAVAAADAASSKQTSQSTVHCCCRVNFVAAAPTWLLPHHSVEQVELPLGATEDRICGTIDIEKALTEGVKAFEPGLLVCLCFCVRHV